MATQNSLLIDRKSSRPDIMTTDFGSAQICSWPRLIKGTNDERPLCKLSPFAVNKAIVAILGSDPFNIKKLRNGSILVEVDKETQSQKLLKTTKLNLTMDNAIPIDVSPHYSLNTKKGVIKWPDCLFVYLGFYVAFNTVQVISRRVVGRAEETSTYCSLGFFTVNCRPTASNYQLSHLRP